MKTTIALILFFACPTLFWFGLGIDVLGNVVASAIGPARMQRLAARLCRID